MFSSVSTSFTRARPRRAHAAVYGALSALALASLAPVHRASAQNDTASIHYKGLTITPGGYFAAEALYRAKSEEADMGSSFNAIPFSGSTAAALSEFRGSARQSRLALGVSGMPDADTRLNGYFESDFLSSGTSSNSNESNSYTLRIRQFYGQARWSNGWGFLAGQAWSTLTTEKQGVAGNAQMNPLTIDAQYSVGFNWARQWQLRAWKGFSDKAWIVGSVEAPQTTFSARGAADNFVLGQAGGSLLNATANYSTDIYPDAVMKLVFEPGYGHFELKALGRAFRDRIFDVADTMGGTHNHVTYGGGVGAAIVLPVNVPEDGGKTRDVFDFGVSGLWGIGIGRYGSGSLPDATVRPNGAISPIRGAQALLTLEAHPSRRLDVYVYGGAEYDARNASIIGAAGEGYGSNLFNVSGCGTEANPTNDYTPAAGTCNADTRALYQGNAGFWYKFYQGPYGAFQWGMQYSYTTRAIWSGAASYQPTAIDQMGFLSFRYVIP